MAKKPPKPYNWGGAANVNWFPQTPPPGLGKSILGSTPNWAPGAIPDWFAPLAGRSPYGGGGGGNPYAGIMGDYLNQQRADFAAQGAADAASRDAALRRYVISYGKVPDFASLGISDAAKGFWQKAIDATTKALAEKNFAEGTAIAARQEAANKVANRRIPAGLAARGMLRSGQTGADLRDQAQAYKIQGFDTLNEMLQGVEGTVGNFLQAERERQMALAQAEMQARLSAMSDWGGDMYGQDSGYGQNLLNWIQQQQQATRPRPPKPPPRPKRPGSLRGVRPGGRR